MLGREKEKGEMKPQKRKRSLEAPQHITPNLFKMAHHLPHLLFSHLSHLRGTCSSHPASLGQGSGPLDLGAPPQDNIFNHVK